MITKAKKISLTPGDIIKIGLGDNMFSFGRVLEEPLIAFYDFKTGDTPGIEAIISLPIIFKICVMNYAVESERWKVIGNYPLDSTLKVAPKFYKQSPLNKKKFFIHYNDEDIPATREECEGLECAAVWEPEHIEDRLRDHYAGVPNQWVESLKPK